jgi:hypothetical protein
MLSTELCLVLMPLDSPTAAAATAGSQNESYNYPASTVAERQALEQDEEAAAAEGRSRLPAFDTASEVQLMAAQVLQRKQQRGLAPKQLAVSQQVTCGGRLWLVAVTSFPGWHHSASASVVLCAFCCARSCCCF